jgi:hypothetical protein
MSRINTLSLADAETVATELQDSDATTNELRLALINALGMIEKLQQEVVDLRSLVTPITR